MTGWEQVENDVRLQPMAGDLYAVILPRTRAQHQTSGSWAACDVAGHTARLVLRAAHVSGGVAVKTAVEAETLALFSSGTQLEPAQRILFFHIYIYI